MAAALGAASASAEQPILTNEATGLVVGGDVSGEVGGEITGLDAFSGFDEDDSDLAPGYRAPDVNVVGSERDLVRPFGSAPDTGVRTREDAPLNEFAGQRRQFDPGVVGGVLGNVKNRILGN